jgi:hydrogenase maturation protease
MDQDTITITILGIGCTLLADQGFGVHIIQQLEHDFEFPDCVQLVDGGMIGVGLVGVLAQSRHVIAIDAIINGGRPGDIYRLQGREILERLKMKNPVQQVDFLEALAHCQALERPPEAVLIAVEPGQTEKLVCELTPEIQGRTDAVVAQVLEELSRLGVIARKKEENKNVFSNSLQNHPY